MDYHMVYDLFRIQSESDESVWYTVYWLANGTFQCTCLGFVHYGHCKHVDYIKQDQAEPE